MSETEPVAGYYWCRYCEVATPGSWELFRRDSEGRWEEAFNSTSEDWTARSDGYFKRTGYEIGPRVPDADALASRDATIAGLREERVDKADAWDAIAAKNQTIAALKAALRIFADYPVSSIGVDLDGYVIKLAVGGRQPTFADFERARALSASSNREDGNG